MLGRSNTCISRDSRQPEIIFDAGLLSQCPNSSRSLSNFTKRQLHFMIPPYESGFGWECWVPAGSEAPFFRELQEAGKCGPPILERVHRSKHNNRGLPVNLIQAMSFELS